jgi:flavin reductase (DIM6/NTAB) family NADH-FMN oxidoreductase RutF
VLNIPTAELARQVVGCGNCHASQGDKFERFHLSHSPASQVAAPLLDDCYASLECQVVDTRMVRRYELFVLEVLAAWVDPAVRTPARCTTGLRALHGRGRHHPAAVEDALSARALSRGAGPLSSLVIGAV